MKHQITPEEEYFIDLYNSRVEEINDELWGMGIGGERKIRKASKAKISTIESDEDLYYAFFDLPKKIKEKIFKNK